MTGLSQGGAWLLKAGLEILLKHCGCNRKAILVWDQAALVLISSLLNCAEVQKIVLCRGSVEALLLGYAQVLLDLLTSRIIGLKNGITRIIGVTGILSEKQKEGRKSWCSFALFCLSLVCIHDSEILGCGFKNNQQNPTCYNWNCSNPVLVLWCCPCTSAWREGDVSKSSVTVVFVARAAQAWENIRLFIMPFS